MVAGAFEFVIDLVAGSDAEEVGNIHVLFISQGNGKSLGSQDVEPGLFSFADKDDHFIIIGNLSPGGIHDIDFAVFIISSDHQYRHWVDGIDNSQIFFHMVFPFSGAWPCFTYR